MSWAAAAGAVGSGLIGTLGSIYSAKKAYHYSKKLMDKQYNLTRKLNQNAYQDTTYSMRRAGINPMLAVSQGVNGLSAGSGGSVNVENPAEAGMSAYATYRQIQNDKKRLKNETELAESNKSLNKWQENKVIHEADLLHHSAAKLREETQLLQEWGPKLKEMEYLTFKNNIENANAVTAAQVKKINSDIELNKSTINRNIHENKYTDKKEQSTLVPKFHVGAGKFGDYSISW